MKVKELLFGGAGGGSAAADFGLLVLRLGAGIALAMNHGFGKIPPTEFSAGVEKLGFPAPMAFAWAAAVAEAVCSLLVAAGFLTRPAALLVVITMGVAFFMAHSGDPFKVRESAFIFGTIFLCILFTGAGRYSIDSALRKG